MKYLVVLRGLPASGKSTFVKKNGFEPWTLSSDRYRLLVSSFSYNIDHGNMIINQECNKQAWSRLYDDLEYRMKRGEFTIIDATHMTATGIKKYRALCKKYFYRMIVVTFDASVQTCIDRDRYRGMYSVGADVIRNMESKKVMLPNSIRQMTPSEFMDFFSSCYQPFDLSQYETVCIIGDIHGCYTALMENLKDLDEETTAFIFVGDYFDRGIEEVEVFNFVYNKLESPNYYFLMGNHEQKITAYLRGEDLSNTQFFRTVLQNFQKNNITDKMLRKFCHNLIPCMNFLYHGQRYIVSHAGVVSDAVNISIADNIFVNGVGKYEDMERICQTYLNNNNEAIQIFGHRNNNNLPIKINDKCYNVCGFPEYGATLKSMRLLKNGISLRYTQNKLYSQDKLYSTISRSPDKFDISDIDTLIGVFRHNKYVRETTFGEISSFQFTKDAFYEEHWDKVVNKARGLFINTKTKNIVARSYDKFFLMNQYDYCTLDKFTPPFRVYQKYDGFLGILGFDKNKHELVYCSKSTIAPYGIFANLFRVGIEPRIKDYQNFIKFMEENNVSFVFECVDPVTDPHIIKYNKEMMVLLDVVSNTMTYNKPLIYENYKGLANEYFRNVIVKYYVGLYNELDIDNLKAQSGEGYVIEDAFGKMFKLKTYEYEIGKICDSIKQYYANAKMQAGEHLIKCPSADKIRQRYCQNYSPYVVENVVQKVPDIIKELNSNG